ncbi:HEAT repeat domain-containing protein [Candidatus Parabeggiatoa sp. HSG14]|uniref:HEAT repeat domain-containing protein n=1 Tax=Candidatus Parabeggiatoa sp. HSG14 TaxID=3055593 RepID=UPI0025A8565C|nr:HEAT repeat domain-containing protein [Thiotrichales bacterium HSG14]
MEPYKGLRPYEEQDKDNFFGRNAEKQILIDKILTNKLTLLFAASGVGKSSLLQAAVMPQLKEPAGENLDVIYHKEWFANPEADLKQTLIDYFKLHHKISDDDSLDVSLPLPDFFHFCTIFTNEPLVIILDQFEEFFNYQRHSKEFKPFVQQLAAAVLDRDTPTVFVFSMREDFALELNAFKPELPTLLFNNFYRLEKLGKENAKQAIIAPVESLGFSYEAGLLDTLLDDLSRREQRDRFGTATDLLDAPPFVEPPHLQIVCMQLWQCDQDNPNQQITIATYKNQGRATKILKDYFVERVQQLSPFDKKLASAAFNYLVNKHGTKMAYPLGDLAKQLRVDEPTLGKTLEKLDQARILRRQKRQNVLWYELYHDIFAKSIYDWNERYKNWQRIKKVAIGTGAVFASGALLFMGNDWWVNQTTYHLRLSLKAGISDTIEVYQGKQESADIFGQQKFLHEVSYTRADIEADKLFQQKSIEKFEYLNKELIEEFPLAERLETDWKNGDIEKVLCFANQYIGSHNKDLSIQTIDKLAGFRSIESINRLKELLLSQNKELKVKIFETLGYSNVPRQLQLTNFLLPFTTDNDPYIRISATDALVQLGTPETIQPLIELLKDTESYVISRAIDGLVQLEAREAVEPLIELLKDKNEYVRHRAASGLGRLGASEAVVPLIELLKDTDSDVRSSAASGLAQLGASEAVEPLIELLKDTDSDVRSSAASGLTQLGASEAVVSLIELLKDTDSDVRRRAASGLAQLGASEAVVPLIQLLKDSDKYVRYSAAEGLAKFEAHEAVVPLIELLKDTDKYRKKKRYKGQPQFDVLIELLKKTDEKRRAGDRLAQLKWREAIELLIQLAKDANETVSLRAAGVLAQLGMRDDAVLPLIELLKDTNSNFKSIRIGLVQLGTHEVVKSLIKLLKDSNYKVRRRAANVLAQLEVHEAISPLIELLKDSNYKVRHTAAKGLAQLGTHEAVVPLTELLQDAKFYVRSGAANGLAQLGVNKAIPQLIELLKDNDGNAINGLVQLGVREAIKPLIQFLKDTKNSDSRNNAIDGLVQLGAREAIQPLIQWLKNANEYEKDRSVAVDGLVQLRAREVIKPLIQKINNSDVHSIAASKWLLILEVHEVVVESLMSLIEKSDKNLPWDALSASTLLDIHNEKLSQQLTKEFAILEKQSHHQSAGQRKKAARKLGKLFVERSVHLLTPLLKDKHLGTQKQAIISLGQIGEQKAEWLQTVLPQLRPFLGDDNIYIRRETVIALGKIVSQLTEEKAQWFDTFADIAKNQEEIFATRLAALKALTKLGTDKAVTLILAMLQPEMLKQESASFILTAFIALGDIRSPVALAFLHKQLEDLSKRKQAWREQRDADNSDTSQTQACIASQTVSDDNKKWQQLQWETDLGYAIAKIDPEKSGIKLLKHPLAEVRKGAWLAISEVATVNIVAKLIEQRHNSKPHESHFRHAAYRAIDNSLITIEVQEDKPDLPQLKAIYQDLIALPQQERHKGIEDRMLWTIYQLEDKWSQSKEI